METILDARAFLLEWEYSHGTVARFRPSERDQSDAQWEYCEVDYPVLPTDGRYRQARYRLVLSVSREPTDTPNEIDGAVTTAEFELDTWGLEEVYPVLFGLSDAGDRVLEYTHDRADLSGAVGDVSSYNYLQVRFEYFEERANEQLEGTSRDEARRRFVELIEEENELRESEDELDPTATYF